MSISATDAKPSDMGSLGYNERRAYGIRIRTVKVLDSNVLRNENTLVCFFSLGEGKNED